jgi:hypothetical protein
VVALRLQRLRRSNSIRSFRPRRDGLKPSLFFIFILEALNLTGDLMIERMKLYGTISTVLTDQQQVKLHLIYSDCRHS